MFFSLFNVFDALIDADRQGDGAGNPCEYPANRSEQAGGQPHCHQNASDSQEDRPDHSETRANRADCVPNLPLLHLVTGKLCRVVQGIGFGLESLQFTLVPGGFARANGRTCPDSNIDRGGEGRGRGAESRSRGWCPGGRHIQDL